MNELILEFKVSNGRNVVGRFFFPFKFLSYHCLLSLYYKGFGLVLDHETI